MPNRTLAEPEVDKDGSPLSAHQHLLLPSNETSAARRRLTSALDGRVSSAVIGIGGVLCLLASVLLVLCSDLCALPATLVKRCYGGGAEGAALQRES